MANEEHLEILGQGVEVWNRWREENSDIRPDLSGADLVIEDLSGADLSQANLSQANLSRADLREANLGEANLSGANLFEADLSSANLSEADLSSASLFLADLNSANLGRADLSEANPMQTALNHTVLSQADLSGAKLFWTNFNSADLNEANLSGAKVGLTVFAGLDLSAVKGLEAVQHLGPSTIGIDTIYRSDGKIPEAFLQGAGVPHTFIPYVASLTGEEIRYYSCLISYSHNDEPFARRLHNDLQGKGVRCWLDQEDIRGGEKLYDQIDQAIRLHDKLLLVLSEHSIHSEWVTTEIRRARKAELREGRRKLFPIRLVDWETIQDWECFDADTGKDLAVEVREYFVPDFSNRKTHDSYHQAFDRLLRDLKASET